jgi:DNA-directed RNA polymerase subunit RPC12/RpoP
MGTAGFIEKLNQPVERIERGIPMLAICEDCSKKYNVDESKMKSDRARFSCQECGHIIVVVKKTAAPIDIEPDSTGKNAADR